MRHVLSVADLETAEIEQIFAITEDLKSKYGRGLREPLLPGRMMALLFEKPSLRTRVSFETAIIHLGGGSMFLGAEAGWGKRESIEDFARVLGRYVDVIVVRANGHQTVEEFAEFSGCSVINGLTDVAHPCQALADLYTVRELVGSLEGKRLAYVGDANNVARSLAYACGKLGLAMAVASPEGYGFDQDAVQRLEGKLPGFQIQQTSAPAEALRDAAFVYTDVWTSMGQEGEAKRRRRDFADYQINAELMAKAPKDAQFMHCLPAHRGEEVTDEVIDGPQSIVLDQAANRMHVQKGILAWLMGPRN